MGEIANKILASQTGVVVEEKQASGAPGGAAPAGDNVGSETNVEKAAREALEKNDGGGAAPVENDPVVVKSPEEIEAERLATQNSSTQLPNAEMSDDDLLTLLKKKTGRDLKSIDELLKPAVAKTPEEAEAEKAANKEKAIQFGLQNKLFNSEALAAFHIDNARSDRDIALEVFAVAQKNLDDTLTPEQIEDQFREMYYEDEDDDNLKKKIKAQEIKDIAKQYRAYKHDAIIGAEDSYNNHVTAATQAANYKGLVESTVGAFNKKQSFKIGDKEYFSDLTDSTMASVQEQLLSSDMFNRLGQGSVSEEQLQTIVRQSAIIKELPRIVKEVAESYASDVLAAEKLGRRGVRPEREGGEEIPNTPAEYQGVAKKNLEKFNAERRSGN